jgi:imidazole glycerol phosphate synthase subunit HisF
MTLHRLIPVILLKNGLIVRSQLFRIHQTIGNPLHTIRRLSNWNVDEVILPTFPPRTSMTCAATTCRCATWTTRPSAY